MVVIRAVLVFSAILLSLTASVPAAAQPAPRVSAPQAAGQQAGRIASIRVVGAQRIEEGTIRSYMLVQPGDPFDAGRLDRSLKALFATGLFADVNMRRDGATLVVTVAENPIVNRIALEGNKKVTDAQLRPELQLRPRAVFTPALAAADRQRILDIYARRGHFAARVEPKIIPLDQNRVDVVFEIAEGDTTLVSRIAFVGNKAFSESRLKDVVGTREEAWYRFMSSSDTYDPDRVNVDRELLRRFYLRNGYADMEVVGASAELAPDRSSFFLTFTINEGERYKLSDVAVNVTLKGVEGDELLRKLRLRAGDWYDGDAVERDTQQLSTEVQNRGYAFVEVKPRVRRDAEKKTIEIVYDVAEGPRVYVERIDIVGNQRTKDKVVRREFRLAEGDAFNASLLRRSRQRITDLEFFNNVSVNANPGSAPDRSIVTARVEERATGELTLGGGYSTDIGPLLTAGLRERNLVGTGIDAGINAILATKQSQVSFTMTDPYFLDRNLVAGLDLFHIQNDLQDVAQYNERRTGLSLRLGYEFSEHLRQVWTYSIIQRSVYDVGSLASIYVQDSKGSSLLSQIGQTLTIDYRDSRIDPREGYVTRLGTDLAGLGGNARFARTKLDGQYYVPLERLTGNTDWTIALSASAGYLFTLGQRERIIDRFFLGGDNLRGFAVGGAGPHAILPGSNSIGGRFIWTQSTELRFPLPVSEDLGLRGRVFVDVGSLSEVSPLSQNGKTVQIFDDAGPRVAAGFGVSWKTPFGLLNIDIAHPIVRKRFDQSQLFRFGFGTRF
ncbi:MAG: outer membrane protein assembly factor BamA [Acetobacteraceae bacterium]|nr:outer membrane protein assembly factor BamA [Acetobacteraceae bacterium]